MGVKRKYHYLEVPILNNEYWVYVIWGDKDRCIKFLKKHFEDVYFTEADFDGIRGKCFSRKGYHPVIYLVDPKHWGTVAHEACHAVQRIWDYIGEESFGEVYAASVGAIVRRVSDYLQKGR